MKQNFTVRRGCARRRRGVRPRCLAPQFSPSSRGPRGGAIGDQSGGTRMQLPAGGFIAACFPNKIKGGSAAAGLGQWPCSIRSLPNWLSLRSDRRMKRNQEKRVVVVMLATLLPIEGPLRVKSRRPFREHASAYPPKPIVGTESVRANPLHQPAAERIERAADFVAEAACTQPIKSSVRR